MKVPIRAWHPVAVVFLFISRTQAEQITVAPQTTISPPASTVSILFLLEDNTTPLFGYSLDVELVPALGAVGSITANIGLTNFFDVQNLITAGGATRDPLFSDISSTADGVFITTNTDDLSTVTATDGVNDVLAQVYFDISGDALGDFSIELGNASALSDGAGFPVAFEFAPATIRVIPEPAALGLLLAGLFAVAGRKQRSRSS